MPRQHLTDFELMISWRSFASDDAYGVPIASEIEHTGKRTVFRLTHTALDCLQDNGLVTSSYGDPTPERGGRASDSSRSQRRGSGGQGTQQAFTALWSGIPQLKVGPRENTSEARDTASGAVRIHKPRVDRRPPRELHRRSIVSVVLATVKFLAISTTALQTALRRPAQTVLAVVLGAMAMWIVNALRSDSSWLSRVAVREGHQQMVLHAAVGPANVGERVSSVGDLQGSCFRVQCLCRRSAVAGHSVHVRLCRDHR